MAAGFPSLRSTVLDTTDARALAEFYRALLGYRYRPGDEPPAAGRPDPRGADWLVIAAPDGRSRLAFQQVDRLARSTWPADGVPQQLHLDLAVGSTEDLAAQHQRILGLGARLLADRFADPDEPLYVYADPAGHPFCVFVAADADAEPYPRAVTRGIEELAGQVRAALEDGDLDRHRELLTPDVRWGPADDPDAGCRNRSEVLSWYRAARADGVRATVHEVLTGPAAIVVGVTVSGRPAAAADGSADRWLVLTVRDGRISDIRGFEERDAAAARAGIHA